MTKLAAIGCALVIVTVSAVGAYEHLQHPADINNDQILERSEILAQLKEKFSKLDSNSNGVLTLNELPREIPITEFERAKIEKRLSHFAHAAKHRGAGVSDELLKQRLQPTRIRFVARHDHNGDEVVSFDEFSAIPLRRFDFTDLDDDGAVTSEERAEARKLRQNRRRHKRG